MEERLFRENMKESRLQFGFTPRRLPGSQLPTNADVVSRLLMIRVEEMEEHSVDERRVPMKKCMHDDDDLGF